MPMFQKKERVYENILRFRTASTHIRTWVERAKDGPASHEDHLAINSYITGRRQVIDTQPLMATAEELARQFPRIVAVEVMGVSGNDGVLLYPRWP